MNVDVFNVFNGDAVTAETSSFPAVPGPTQIIMLARFVQISAQFDFCDPTKYKTYLDQLGIKSPTLR